MSKIIVFGDIHGRRCWTDIIAKENPDKVVFLGDYVSTHENISEEIQIDNLEGILQYKETYPDKVILLRGNHDIEALGYSWAECYPITGRIIKDYLKENKERFLQDTQWIYIYKNLLFSHAGISKIWLEQQQLDLETLNNEEPSPKFGFIPESFRDDNGSSATQSCTWIRPVQLYYNAYKPEKYIQIVGHTRQFMNKISRIQCTKETDPIIWLCDCLPNEYLVINNGEFIPKKV